MLCNDNHLMIITATMRVCGDFHISLTHLTPRMGTMAKHGANCRLFWKNGAYVCRFGKAQGLGSGRARSERLYTLIWVAFGQPFAAMLLATGLSERQHRSCLLPFSDTRVLTGTVSYELRRKKPQIKCCHRIRIILT